MSNWINWKIGRRLLFQCYIFRGQIIVCLAQNDFLFWLEHFSAIHSSAGYICVTYKSIMHPPSLLYSNNRYKIHFFCTLKWMVFSVHKTNRRDNFTMFNSITKAVYCWAYFSWKQINSNYSLTSSNRNHSTWKIFVVKLK